MSAIAAVALIVVLISGSAVVLVHEPVRQALMLGIFGIALSLLFFAYQAPDVALSEIVVSSLAMPLIVLAALRRLRDQARAREGDES